MIFSAKKTKNIHNLFPNGFTVRISKFDKKQIEISISLFFLNFWLCNFLKAIKNFNLFLQLCRFKRLLFEI